ncbi:SH3 domain-containing protein [Bdellovibrio svalbardensis]|uniref:SH3 domain-containing protein n=1 Tax=Bdellovibrio svalbardensis TaxID=2972972 RepID=A0ABT6DNE5_9BACT|nr:SH3 domain-containing protein [Bdellovibrio svalbardensis]MDG0817459.1 SH3 domain-containing protein [Bdellovibrio svalbardensis]
MFGSCVLNRGVSLLFVTLLFPVFVWAQAQQGTVVGDEAQVYQDPDFDSPIITVVPMGSVYSISKAKKGPFYKIRVKPGTVGWIVDSDIHPGVFKVTPETQAEVEKLKEQQALESKKRPFFATRYWGPVAEYLNYTEDTMGDERSAGTLFYGLKWNGYNTIFSGEIYTDAEILFHSGAPSYYQDLTGQSAGGFIVNANFLLQTVSSVSKSMLFYYGFGPTWRYSHFDLHLTNGSTVSEYSADDMALGILFDVGVGYRIGRVSVRTDARYYWEKNKYYGLGVNLGWEF